MNGKRGRWFYLKLLLECNSVSVNFLESQFYNANDPPAQLHNVQRHLFVAVDRIVFVVQALQCVQVASVQCVDLFLARIVGLLEFDRPTNHRVNGRSVGQHAEVFREQSSAFEDHEGNVEPGGQSLLDFGDQMIVRMPSDVVHVVLTEHNNRYKRSSERLRELVSHRCLSLVSTISTDISIDIEQALLNPKAYPVW